MFSIPLNLPSILSNTINLNNFCFYFVLNKSLYSKFLNIEVLEQLNKLEVEISSVEFFYKNSNNVGPGAHVDDLYTTDFIKLNWIYGDLTAKMVWYKPIENFRGLVSSHHTINYLYFPPDRITEIHSEILQSPSIVQVGIPHSIKNISSERWAISLTLTKNGQFIDINNAFHLFSNLRKTTGF